MSTWQAFSIWLHVVAAALWVGGMLFLALVLVPALKGHPERTKLILLAARRFSKVGWAALALLVVTGTFNLHMRGLLPSLFEADFFASGYGRVVGYKLGLVLMTLLMSGVHDFWIGPAAVRAMQRAPEAPRTQRLRAAASWMGRLNLLIALTIVALAVAVVRGPLQ